MERRFKETNKSVGEKIHALRREIGTEFGFLARLAGNLAGPLLLWTARREEKLLARGKTYEPRTIIERRNWAEAEV